MKSCPIKTKYVPLQDMECCTVCVSLCVQSRLTLCDPMAYSPPGSSVHGIFKARILEQVAIAFPGDLSNPGMEFLSTCLLHWQMDSLPLSHLESPGLEQILIIDEEKKKKKSVKVLATRAGPPFCISMTVASQSLLSMGFSGQEYWSGQPFPSPGDFPNPGIKPVSLALQVDSLPLVPPGKPFCY